jgi:hypothetical protein
LGYIPPPPLSSVDGTGITVEGHAVLAAALGHSGIEDVLYM